MELSEIVYAVEENVGHITFNQPESMNSLTLNTVQELLQAVLAADDDPGVRAVLIDAKGKMFSAGGNVKFFHEQGDRLARTLKEMTTYLHAAQSRLARMTAPVVIAVQGTAAGGGMSLAVSGDLTLAAESAKFTMAYTAAGLSPDGGSTFNLPRLIGLQRTKELMLTNRVLSAAEAREWGLITRVVPDEKLGEEAGNLARQLAQGPTRALGAVKRMLADTLSTPYETQMELESEQISAMGRTVDAREGIEAFATKRKPKFSGN